MISQTGKMRQLDINVALELAMDALIFLSSDKNRLVRFLSITGYQPDDIRQHAHSHAFLAGVLDFMLEDESLLLAFAANGNHDPAIMIPARNALSQITESKND